jgi:DNA repair protein RecO (recombination protein O)
VRIDQQPAFILHARAYRETSLLLECYTRDFGRIGAVARGVRRERSRMPRALLQPLTPVSLGWSGSGDLVTLIGVEARDAALDLAGEALLCGLYVNELLLRLTPRHDAHAGLFADYARTLGRLSQGENPPWTLRRFERDLLDRLGYGVDLSVDSATGALLDPQMTYGYRHEAGPVPWRSAADGPRASGAALLALARDERPADTELAQLRRWLRAVIAVHLDGGELQSWKLLAEMPKVEEREE